MFIKVLAFINTPLYPSQGENCSAKKPYPDDTVSSIEARKLYGQAPTKQPTTVARGIIALMTSLVNYMSF